MSEEFFDEVKQKDERGFKQTFNVQQLDDSA